MQVIRRFAVPSGWESDSRVIVFRSGALGRLNCDANGENSSASFDLMQTADTRGITSPDRRLDSFAA